MLVRHAFHARYAHERGKTFQQFVRVRTDVGFAVHNKNLLNRVDYSSDWEWLSTKWLFLYAISPSRCMAAQLGGQRTAVHAEVVGQLLTVERNVERV